MADIIRTAPDSQTTDIDYTGAKAGADEIKGYSKVLENILESFASEMGIVTSEEVLAGKAGDALGDKFRVLRAKFKNYSDKVAEFSAAIDNAVGDTGATEQGLTTGAEELPN